MKRVLIITHSSDSGLNFRQMKEIENLLGYSNYEITSCINPEKIVEWDVVNSDKIIMIVPEWNGSFPWTFKKLIDDSGWPSFFADKEILLVGTSNSTFGNLLGITHLKHILEWCSANVYKKRVCVPNIDVKFSDNNIKVDLRMNEIVKEFCS